MHVIPAIDLLDGKVVRLHKGDYEQAVIYSDNPLEEARKFKKAGFYHIHIVDLNGAREGKFINLEYILKIIDETGLSVQMGGGIRSNKDAEKLLKSGISKVICSSMAVRNPENWLELLNSYPERSILGMDLKNGQIAYSGWKKTVDNSLEVFLKPMLKNGLQEVLCTDISRDGTMEGPNINLYKKLMKQFPQLRFIASGGVGNLHDLELLQNAGIQSIVVGKAYYEGKIALEELSQFSTL